MSDTSGGILQVIATIAPHFGGPAVASLRLNEALIRQGPGGCLLTTDLADPSGHRLSELEVQALAQGDNCVVLCPASRPYRAEFSWRMIVELWREVGAARVVLLHGLHRPPTIAAYAVARLRHTPILIAPHGLLEPFQREVSPGKKAVFDKVIGRRMLRDAALVLFTSASEASRAADVVHAGQAFVHSLGADLAPSAPLCLPESDQDRYESFTRDRRFCYLGRLAAKKQPILLIEAWARSSARRSSILVIAGPDADFTAGDLRAEAERHGVSDSILVCGPIYGGERTALLEGCGTFVLPSLNENFGMTIGEAMWAGCHVVTTTEAAAHEHVLAADAGLVLVDPDADELAAALDAAVGDDEASRTSGERARDYAEACLSWDSLATALDKALTARLI